MRTREVIGLWLFVALVVVVVLRTFVVAPFQVVSVSMAPTLVVGDWLVVDKLAYRTKVPERGDVIVWKSSSEHQAHDFVKRVVGLPGDVVTEEEGRLSVNGTALPREFVGEVALGEDGAASSRTRFLLGYEWWDETLGTRSHAVLTSKMASARSDAAWTVPPGRLFVVGDNRDESVDSRAKSFGEVALNEVVGRVCWILISRGNEGWNRQRSFSRVR